MVCRVIGTFGRIPRIAGALCSVFSASVEESACCDALALAWDELKLKRARHLPADIGISLLCILFLPVWLIGTSKFSSRTCFLSGQSEIIFVAPGDLEGVTEMEISIREDFGGIRMGRDREDLINRLDYIPRQLDMGLEYL